MGNYLRLGPVHLRVSTKHLANWGYPAVRIAGLSLLTRDNGGRLHLASYHPKGCTTWHWFIALYRSRGARRGWFNLQRHKGFGERGVALFGWTLSLTEQGYHKERRA